MKHTEHIKNLKEQYIFELKALDRNNHGKLVEPDLNINTNDVAIIRNAITEGMINDSNYDLCSKTILLSYESVLYPKTVDVHILGVDATGVICLDTTAYNNQEIHRVTSIDFECFNIDNIAYLLDACTRWV